MIHPLIATIIAAFTILPKRSFTAGHRCQGYHNRKARAFVLAVFLTGTVAVSGCSDDFKRQRAELDANDAMRTLRCPAPIVPMLSADTTIPQSPGKPSAHIVKVTFQCGESTSQGLEYNIEARLLLTRAKNSSPSTTETLTLYVASVDQDLQIHSRVLSKERVNFSASTQWLNISAQILLPYPLEDDLINKEFPSSDQGPLPISPVVLTSPALRQYITAPKGYAVYVGLVPFDHDLDNNAAAYQASTTTFAKIWRERGLGQRVSRLAE